VSDSTPFQLSRIYAQGWLAGMESQVDGDSGEVEAAAAALNPCVPDDAKAKWSQGFREAVLRKQARPAGKGLKVKMSRRQDTV
jgi:hypothetical protein